MSDLRAAAQQALEALEEATNYTGCEAWSPSMTDECLAAATALKAALEQDDKDRVWIEERKAAWAKDKEIARKNAELERERHYTPGPCDIAEDGVCEVMECCNVRTSALCPEQVRAQPEQEPYGYFKYDMRLDAWVNSHTNRGIAFYTQPPRREWRGLTDEDIHNLPTYQETREMYQLARAIEATLKERNA